MNAVKTTIVVAAVIRDDKEHILLARRPEGRHMAGLWEFPGGKVDDGEAPEAALHRELLEELGVLVGALRPITFAVHEEAGLRILLLFYSAEITGGDLVACEGQEIAWVPPGRLRSFETPPADAAVVDMLAGDTSA
jgi:8-oxo-dGTP diphosphatase